jgi:Mce-associated membrane protein
MVSPRERPRQSRRRIAGERTRPPGADRPEEQAQQQAQQQTEQRASVPTRPAPVEPVADRTPEPAPENAPENAPETARETGTRSVTAPGTGSEAASEPTGTAGEARAEDRAEDRAEEPAEEPVAVAVDRDDVSGPPNWVLGVLAGLLVAALALDGLVAWREVSQQRQAEESARALHSALIQAPAVAEQAATALLSYRYDTVDQDLAEARKYLTEDYRPEYVESINLVNQGAGEVGATVKADVLSSGVVEASGQRSDVLLFVNQTTTMPAQQPTTALNRVVLTMVPRGNTWVVADIRAF